MHVKYIKKMNHTTEALWQTFSGSMRGFILKKVQNPDVTEDILQETFIRIHSKIDSVKDETRIKGWVFQIANNLVMDHFRAAKKEGGEITQEQVAEEEAPNEFLSETISDMLKMMDDLPGEYCDALCSTELDGMKMADYAVKAGISYTAAKTRIFRAKKMLKDAMMNCCHYQFDKYGTIVDISPKACCCCCDEGNTNSCNE
jgi:RNA polymerase sigma-70 factor (ECF subfamily)